ncbi:hypothetical protein HDU93_002307 [Gonapodya sp. JEL0774]|nr:hypothetical protein HDU93_002307 [Gonapodya sp. JEL0774]
MQKFLKLQILPNSSYHTLSPPSDPIPSYPLLLSSPILPNPHNPSLLDVHVDHLLYVTTVKNCHAPLVLASDLLLVQALRSRNCTVGPQVSVRRHHRRVVLPHCPLSPIPGNATYGRGVCEPRIIRDLTQRAHASRGDELKIFEGKFRNSTKFCCILSHSRYLVSVPSIAFDTVSIVALVLFLMMGSLLNGATPPQPDHDDLTVSSSSNVTSSSHPSRTASETSMVLTTSLCEDGDMRDGSSSCTSGRVLVTSDVWAAHNGLSGRSWDEVVRAEESGAEDMNWLIVPQFGERESDGDREEGSGATGKDPCEVAVQVGGGEDEVTRRLKGQGDEVEEIRRELTMSKEMEVELRARELVLVAELQAERQITARLQSACAHVDDRHLWMQSVVLLQELFCARSNELRWLQQSSSEAETRHTKEVFCLRFQRENARKEVMEERRNRIIVEEELAAARVKVEELEKRLAGRDHEQQCRLTNPVETLEVVDVVELVEDVGVRGDGDTTVVAGSF